jgi:beta-N-acetylhexosaminidase
MTTPRAVIFGLQGLTLTEDERQFFADCNPLGFILFARNCANPEQVRVLTDSLRDSVGRFDAPVLIDQEGGRVQRLKPPHWRAAPPASTFGRLAVSDPDAGREATYINARLFAAELHPLGVDVDCLPVLDVPVPGAHDIIGDRAFGPDPTLVSTLGRAACEGLLAGGVLPVIKHIPGHGRAQSDSHLALPVVDVSAEELAASDFVPFRLLNDMRWGMTAHVLYRALDPQTPATLSERVIQGFIRSSIGFDGLLLTDDISMKALAGSMADRTKRSLAAGCDVVLHCNGEMGEMREIADAAGTLGDHAVERFERGRRSLVEPDQFDVQAGQARLQELMTGT